ncbi:MAG: hypothetical protein EOO06_13140 [Chitinophagaceae bacterium]|nr:MAG: hypothetical protein EOO06_13140 [Chitinophagaceae bacterium]
MKLPLPFASATFITTKQSTMTARNTARKGRPSTSSAKPEKNSAGKKNNPAAKSPAKKQWSKEKNISREGIKPKDKPSGKEYQQLRSGSGKGGAVGRVAERAGAEGTPGQASAAGVRDAAPKQKPGPGSFKTYRKNQKANRDDSRARAGAAPSKNKYSATDEEARRFGGSQPAKGKGNGKRDAFSKRQLGPAKALRSETAEGENSFVSKPDRDISTRQNKPARSKPTDNRHKASKRTKAAPKRTARPAGKRSPSKRRR